MIWRLDHSELQGSISPSLTSPQLPRINDLLEKIGAAKYITILNLYKGYLQVAVKKICRP